MYDELFVFWLFAVCVGSMLLDFVVAVALTVVVFVCDLGVCVFFLLPCSFL